MKLELFYFNTCPFCLVVLYKIKRLGIKVQLNNIHSQQEHLDRLVETTGRKTVPCLFIDGQPMFESADIVTWLEANKDKIEKEA